MKCPHCGVTVSDADTFCFQCGAALEHSEDAKPRAADVSAPPKTYAPEIRDFSYAGFWKRFVAWIIDGIILIVINIPITFLLSFMLGPWQGSISWIVSFTISLLYYAFQESSVYQATLGKRALGIVVTDMEGKRISFGRAAARELAKYISALVLGIGFLIIGFTEKKQGLHDIIVGCLVINR